LKAYLALIRNSFINALFFRSEFLLKSLGNLLILTVLYFLWKAIYAGNNMMGSSLNFSEAFLYLAMSNTLYSLIETKLDYNLSRSITTGGIVMRLYRPLDLHISSIFNGIADFLITMITSGIPGFLLIILVFQVPVPLGINLLLFLLSSFVALLIAANLDFTVGVSAYSFESIVGLTQIKRVIVMFMAGAVVPLPLFPEKMRQILMFLPFQAMLHTPVNILLGKQAITDSIKGIGLQICWFFFFLILGRLFHLKIMKKMTINGG